MDEVECIVVGAGVIGLAIARRLAQSGREVIILDAASMIGSETSSRSSEVIHAGIYYPTGSLMAELCVAGRKALYEYCERHAVPHRRCGKLIVATQPGEVAMLSRFAKTAAANGVGDIRELSGAAAMAMEPELAAVAALLSPSTGIIDSHAYMLALLAEAEDAGAVIALRTPVEAVDRDGDTYVVRVGGADATPVRCRMLINAAGHNATVLARSIEGFPVALVPDRFFAKGSYFSLAGKAPFSRLIYPVPAPGGLGTHLTLDLDGRARFGPDVEWIDEIDYAVDDSRAESFYAGIRRYYPGLRDGALSAAYAGVRPKIVPPEIGLQDFMIQGPQLHGMPGLVNLFGIESPGLTASPAIADYVSKLLG